MPIGKMRKEESAAHQQQYCLRWKNHEANLKKMFAKLFESQKYCDVGLASEGKVIKAHRIVLCACSSYFESILWEYGSNSDPIIVLKDVRFADILNIMEFMYKGELNAYQSDLDRIVKLAEDLKIKGLAEITLENNVPMAEENIEKDELPANCNESFPENLSPASDHTCSPNRSEEISNFDNEIDEYLSETTGEQNGWSNTKQTTSATVNDLKRDDEIGFNDESAVSKKSSISRLTYFSQIKQEFADVIPLKNYLNTGRRQQFWEEPFTRRVFDAIRDKSLELKAAAEILGVSYGTLYGRYRETYGCLKNSSKTKEFWGEIDLSEIISKLKLKELTLPQAAEILTVSPKMLMKQLQNLCPTDLDIHLMNHNDADMATDHEINNTNSYVLSDNENESPKRDAEFSDFSLQSKKFKIANDSSF